MLAATDPDDVLRNDLYDRDRARQWSRGPVVVVGDAAHPMRPHLGQGGCQGLEDAAVLARFVDGDDDLAAAFARFAAFRRPRVRALVRESKLIGQIVNLRPAVPQRPRRPGDGSGARSVDDPAPGYGGGAVGVRAAQRPRHGVGVTVSLGPLLVDAVEPRAVERFWAAALGWPAQRALCRSARRREPRR